MQALDCAAPLSGDAPQPKKLHEPWHVDIADINFGGTPHYLCTVLDGGSRQRPHVLTGARTHTHQVSVVPSHERRRHSCGMAHYHVYLCQLLTSEYPVSCFGILHYVL